MKKRSLFLSLLLSVSLIPGVTAGPAKTGGHEHEHDHEARGTYIDSLPKAKDFKDLKGKVQIERTVNTKILDEKGNVTGTKTFKKNTGKGSFSTQAGTGSQKVSVLAVADAQYRAKSSDWQTRIVQIIEQADVMFNRDHDVDFVVEAVERLGPLQAATALKFYQTFRAISAGAAINSSSDLRRTVILTPAASHTYTTASRTAAPSA